MPAQPIKGGQLRVLTDDEVRRIDRATAAVLARTGVKMEHPEALGICAEHGCDVDFGAEIVRMPEEVWRGALERAPSGVPLYGRSPERDVMLDDSDDVYVMGGAGALWVVDLDGRRRPATLHDLRELTRLQDAFEFYHIAHFLDSDHTVRYLRRTRWQPAISDRNRWETWEERGATTMRQRANAEARRILQEHHPQYVTAEQTAEIDRIAAAAQQDQARKHASASGSA